MRSAKIHWPYLMIGLIALNAAGFLGSKLWYGGAGIRPLVKAWPFFVAMNGSALIAFYLEVRPKIRRYLVRRALRRRWFRVG